jgi:hypothetical protein
LGLVLAKIVHAANRNFVQAVLFLDQIARHLKLQHVRDYLVSDWVFRVTGDKFLPIGGVDKHVLLFVERAKPV